MQMEKNFCQGFSAAGIAAGIKKNGKKDLGLIFSQVPATVAGVFTKNLVQAAPVLLDRERVHSGVCRAVIANSGNANCSTGAQGMKDAIAMSGDIAKKFDIAEHDVLVASTGVIGQPMPVKIIHDSIADLAAALKTTEDGINDFAESIMTTDTIPKIISVSGNIDTKAVTITGVAKGAGMIRPDMATMLCFICTDADIEPAMLQTILTDSTDNSFNKITIDGDTSTNDTVLLLANGLSGAKIRHEKEIEIFQNLLNEVMIGLAKMVVKDGEGVTKLVKVKVEGAKTVEDAARVADTIAHSNLVKTALFGEDANWGRIMMAAGRAGVKLDPDKIDIYFDDVMMAKDGMGCGQEAEALVDVVLKKPEFDITVNLNMGSAKDFIYTCDLSVEYIKINADYRT